jgi:hypothetical protein
MSAPVPSLDGWITSPSLKSDYLIGCFFISEASQSYVYDGNIASLTGIIQQYGNDNLQLQTQMKNMLAMYLSGYFDQVNVDCIVQTTNTVQAGRMDVTVSVQLVDDGVSYSMGYLAKMLNGVAVQIMNLNNTGSA